MPDRFVDIFTESGALDGDLMPTEGTNEFLERIGFDPSEAIPYLARCYGPHDVQFILAGIQIGYYIAQLHFSKAAELERALGDINLEP